MERKDVYMATLIAHRFILQTRVDAASCYVLNQGLQTECSILRKQVDAINAELDRITRIEDIGKVL